MTWTTRIADSLAAIEARGQWRAIRTVDHSAVNSAHAPVEFASNDYLGLSHHPKVIAAARNEAELSGTGATAARLIVGGRQVHDDLEAALAQWCDREAALLFSTGYQANLGVLDALSRAAGPTGALICSDELNHASIIDGARLARAEVAVYPHCDVAALDALLAAADRPAIVVSDAVFSMDGDLAPLDELAAACHRRDALLMVDEAHALLGPTPPAGAIVVGTLSKTLGAQGGFVAADRAVIDLCTNTARSFIFTTALAPPSAAAALAALEVLRSDEGAALIERLRVNIDLVRPGHPSPIIPVVLGDEERSVSVSRQLLDRGLLVPAIRPPTVAPGTCRLRVAISATHTPEQIGRLITALTEIGVDLHA